MAKFKIGDEVIVEHGKDTNMTLVIVQIEEATCSVGTQTKYTGRVWVDSPEKGMERHRICFFRDASFNEIELRKER
jgi:hypothetical protein